MKNEPLEIKILELEARVEALEKISATPIGHSVVSTTKQKILSPKEFLMARDFSGDVETTFILCFYAEQVLRMESFNIGDIEQLFRTAKMPVPKNLNDKINKNIHKGYLTEAAEKKNGMKAWVVTMKGEGILK